jgi:Peptidase family M23/Bacterial tandem repeat domain 1
MRYSGTASNVVSPRADSGPARTLGYAVRLSGGILPLLLLAQSPAITIDVEQPLENGRVVFQQLGPPARGAPFEARISIRIKITNNESSNVAISKIEINGLEVSDFSAPVTVMPGATYTFQNCTCATIAKSLVVSAPFPSTARISVYLSGSASPFTISAPIQAHTNDNGPLAYPANASDLRRNESWGTSSDHIADHQVFALDMGVWGWNSTLFSEKFASTDDVRKEHWRSYGMPVYAMADGTVCWALGDHQERPDVPSTSTTISPSLGAYNPGGNQVFVKTGDEIAVYAHLQPGSIPPELLTTGAAVKKGQFLGKVGLSGDTGRPHTHIHVKKVPSSGAPDPAVAMNGCDSGFFRPMTFEKIQSLTKEEADGLGTSNTLQSSDWTTLTNHSAPHPYALINPSATSHAFCPGCSDNRQYVGIWRSSADIELRLKALGWESFTKRFDDLSADGFRLTDIETFVENGKREFLGLFKRESDKHAIVYVTGWSNFTAEWARQARRQMRLIDVTTFRDARIRYYVGVFRAGDDRHALIGRSGWNEFSSEWAQAGRDNLRLVDLEAYKENGIENYIGVFRAGSDAHALISTTGWDAFTAQWAQAGRDRLRLIDMESFPAGGQRQYVGVFRAGEYGHTLGSYTGYDRFFMACERSGYEGLRLVDFHVEQ